MRRDVDLRANQANLKLPTSFFLSRYQVPASTGTRSGRVLHQGECEQVKALCQSGGPPG
jgi:hypothetical protein